MSCNGKSKSVLKELLNMISTVLFIHDVILVENVLWIRGLFPNLIFAFDISDGVEAIDLHRKLSLKKLF